MTAEPEPWAPEACTLPTAEQPLREAEFDDLFTTCVRAVHHQDATVLRLDLEPTAEVAARTADLAVRETGCCSFFTFALVATGGVLRLDITVEEAHSEVLEALAARATRLAS
ncbi:hypothetical protein C8D87_1011002 [Lentzea atacamensis]|uniref:Arsenate reductase n=1 Tax=Lentzea atacamensis TaxID=531938 RepID=A0ABX9EHP3_9PSEU|nr:hypothetical protein [Lentzea atacamensis]RAS70701.1 hypothetical protein C8D87_1011002 [Lentzea atacamensis]